MDEATYVCSVCGETDLPVECVTAHSDSRAICKACEFDLTFDSEGGEALITDAEDYADSVASSADCTCTELAGHAVQCRRELAWLDAFDERVNA